MASTSLPLRVTRLRCGARASTDLARACAGLRGERVVVGVSAANEREQQWPAQLAGNCVLCATPHATANDVGAGAAGLAALFHDLEHDPALFRARAALSATRGKMLGVLVGEAPTGERVVLRAFSGDLGGAADWPSFAPSIIRREATAVLEAQTLTDLDVIAQAMPEASPEEALRLRRRRRQLSAALMAAMHDHVRLTNAGGHTARLRDVFAGRGIPSGTADCCLPKLLQHANQLSVRVVACAEAWWGPSRGGRVHGRAEAPCAHKCVPILGFLLCRRPP